MSRARDFADLAGSADAGGLTGKNMVVNGAMQVAQRGTSSTSTANISYHTVDRFNFRGQSTGVYTIAQDTDAPTDFNNSTKITVTTPDATIGGGERYWVASYLEGNTVSSLNFGSSNAKTVTLSFYVKSSLTGTFSGGLVNSAFDRAYAFTYVISSANTWEKKTITIAGDTSGTWLTNNGIGISVVWDLGAATNRQQSAGAWTASGSVSATGASHVIATNNATWQITGVQLEVGEQATPFEHRSFADELYRCKRYFQKSFNYDTAPENGDATGISYNGGILGYCGSNNNGTLSGFHRFDPEMRATPSITTYGNNSGHWGRVIPTNTGTTTFSAGSGYMANIKASGINFGQNVSGDTLMIGFGHITASAEL